MKKLSAVLAVITLLFTTGCDDNKSTVGSHDEHSEFQEKIEHVEEHFVDGPFLDVTLAAAPGDAKDVSKEHTCYHVSGPTKGYVSYTITLEEGETETDRYIFIDNADVTIEVMDAQGEEVHGHDTDLDEVTTTVIKKGVTLHELTAGKYTIMLNNMPASGDVDMVIAHAEHEHGHEDDH